MFNFYPMYSESWSVPLNFELRINNCVRLKFYPQFLDFLCNKILNLCTYIHIQLLVTKLLLTYFESDKNFLKPSFTFRIDQFSFSQHFPTVANLLLLYLKIRNEEIPESHRIRINLSRSGAFDFVCLVVNWWSLSVWFRIIHICF